MNLVITNFGRGIDLTADVPEEEFVLSINHGEFLLPITREQYDGLVELVSAKLGSAESEPPENDPEPEEPIAPPPPSRKRRLSSSPPPSADELVPQL